MPRPSLADARSAYAALEAARLRVEAEQEAVMERHFDWVEGGGVGRAPEPYAPERGSLEEIVMLEQVSESAAEMAARAESGHEYAPWIDSREVARGAREMARWSCWQAKRLRAVSPHRPRATCGGRRRPGTRRVRRSSGSRGDPDLADDPEPPRRWPGVAHDQVVDHVLRAGCGA